MIPLATGLLKQVLTVPLVTDHHKQVLTVLTVLMVLTVLTVLTVLMIPLVMDQLNQVLTDLLVLVEQPLELMILLLVMDLHTLVQLLVLAQLLVLVLVPDTVLLPPEQVMVIQVMAKALLDMVTTLLVVIKDSVPNLKPVLTILMLRLHNYQNICKRKPTRSSKEVTTMLRNHLNLNKIKLALYIE